ncbi:unnamed protein product [Aphanomyces euteiches]|uniref:Palmitoyl-protein thioesterase 1 n=1 Tax=Aphanomyces euteiches TaxID=100861 RepID=A0A6G0XAB8_9STRA|nr:hypothetical protein Ae201684_006870 [Aphanomyces euteiches]KAH9087212.1 hypothetical protein Ae201684P_000623 [Aphanomyces euteiches]KAH9158112.1 hypothetical protein AeRB84_000148 [Aphanomyces euteiches]
MRWISTSLVVLAAVTKAHRPAVWQPEGLYGDEGMIVALDERHSLHEERIAPHTLPVVVMHGMGDAAQNPGMQRLRKAIEDRVGTYVTNVQIGSSQAEDTLNGFFMNLNKQVDYFANVVAKDPKLANGFNAMGFSQGNLVIRGYIERYNNPPVHSFLSVHGPLAGVAALPHCQPTNIICKTISQMISTAAYADSIQAKVTQANYFRDPKRIPEYLEHALFLPDINNEKKSKNTTYKDNFVKLDHLVLVRAAKDTMVYPHASEWFGAYEDGNWDKVLPMNETTWYKEDSFGLKTLDQQGKITFIETPGDHLQLSTTILLGWIDQYFA